MFSFPSKRKHAGVGRNTTSVELERKNLADLRCEFLRRHNKKASSIVKETLSASVCKRKIAQCRLKNIRRGFTAADVGITTTDVGYCLFYSIPE